MSNLPLLFLLVIDTKPKRIEVSLSFCIIELKNKGIVYSWFSPSRASLTKQSKNCILGLTYFWINPCLLSGFTNFEGKINQLLCLHSVVNT